MDFVRIVFNCVSSFCNCITCNDDLRAEGYESNERSHLLVATVNTPTVRCINSDNLSNEYSQSLPKKDEQNALTRLVHDTAVNMIDVGAMNLHNLEHHELNDRMKLYSQRLQQQWSTVYHPESTTKGFLKDIPNPENYLRSVAISWEDSTQIKSSLVKALNAVNSIKVEHKENIVVPFRISEFKI